MSAPLELGPNRNIAAFLSARAQTRPELRCVVYPHAPDRLGRTSLTYGEMDRQSDILAAGLQAHGVTRGMRTVLFVTPSLAFFELVFALFKLGAVPVMIDPGMGLANLAQCLREADPQAFIGTTKAHLARLLLCWPAVPRLVTVGAKLGWGGISFERLRALGEGQSFQPPLLSDEDPAAILFTSGSTGVPKGAEYSHGIFQAQIRALRKLYGIEEGEVDLATFPLFALFAPALGMTAVIPRMDFTRPAQVDPDHILQLVQREGVTNMFGSPALLNRVGRHGVAIGAKLPGLRRVTSAGAPVAPAILARFSQLLSPGVQIHTPYGATESLPVASIASGEILAETGPAIARGAGVCVGRPVEEILVRVIAIDDGPIASYTPALDLPAGQVGELAVRGPMVTRAYFRREQATALAKMRDAADGAIWHRMGDLGYLDAEGRLWFCGRKAHRVVTAAGTLFSVAVEGVFNAHPAVFRSALVGLPGAAGARPVVCIELEAEHQRLDRKRLVAELVALGAACEATRGLREFAFPGAFPVDIRHNAKIFREKLADWVANHRRQILVGS